MFFDLLRKRNHVRKELSSGLDGKMSYKLSLLISESFSCAFIVKNLIMIFLLFYSPYFCIVTVFWSLTLYSSSHYGVEVRVPWILIKREGKRLCPKINAPEKKSRIRLYLKNGTNRQISVYLFKIVTNLTHCKTGTKDPEQD